MHPLKFISLIHISDGLLREFIYRELWKVALDQIESSIAKCEQKIYDLRKLKLIIENNKEKENGSTISNQSCVHDTECL